MVYNSGEDAIPVARFGEKQVRRDQKREEVVQRNKKDQLAKKKGHRGIWTRIWFFLESCYFCLGVN